MTVLLLVTLGCAREPHVAADTTDVRVGAVRPAGSFVAARQRLGVAGCPLFPEDHVFHADVRSLPVSPFSESVVAAIGAGMTVRPGFGALVWLGSRAGYPVNVVDATARPTDVVTYYQPAHPDHALGIPMPPEPRFEGWPGRAWDRHLLLVDPASCVSTELINVMPPGENLWAGGHWYADGVAEFDLRSNEPPRFAVTASGVSLLAGLVRYDEVASGSLNHVVGLTVPDIAPRAVWPARTSDGRAADPHAPPMGTWLRLRADADLSALGPQATVVARALQGHGGIVVDTGPGLTVVGEPDVRWDDRDLASLSTLVVGDFEVVDPSPMKVADRSHQIR